MTSQETQSLPEQNWLEIFVRDKFKAEVRIDSYYFLGEIIADAKGFLSSKGIEYGDKSYSKYVELISDKAFSEWDNSLIKQLQIYKSTNLTTDSNGLSTYDVWERIPENQAISQNIHIISAVLVIEKGSKIFNRLQELIFTTDPNPGVGLKELWDLMNQMGWVYLARYTTRWPDAKARVISEEQGRRKREQGEATEGRVKEIAREILAGPEGRHYRWNNPKQKKFGQIKKDNLKEEIARRLTLSEEHVGEVLKKMWAIL